jgi:hypothetical protein
MKDKYIFGTRVFLIFLFVFTSLFLGMNTCSAQEVREAEVLEDSLAQPPAPSTNVMAKDKPNDNGHALVITWTPSADDGAGKNNVISYEILRSDNPDTGFVVRGMVPAGTNQYEDKGDKDKGSENYFPNQKNFYYQVRAKAKKGSSLSLVSQPAYAYGQLFHTQRAVILVACVIFTVFTVMFISKAKKGEELYVRPLAGIAAVDDAIGRATEMGRPILYILGLGTAADIATIASFSILSRIAKMTAEHRTSILVPCYDPIVMMVAQETVRAAYLDAGRPDMYKEDNINYITSMQFAYVAAVNGIMLRERTATNFYLGKFYAESLILAETGSVAGSIQISGTDEVAQIPFFVAATDYTLIGEELYAASAYLGREPLLLGTLKAQDWAKALVMISLILGGLATSFHFEFFKSLFFSQ